MSFDVNINLCFFVGWIRKDLKKILSLNMYFIFSFELLTPQDLLKTEQIIEYQLQKLGLTKFAKPLQNVYLIRCSDSDIRKTFAVNMLAGVKTGGNKFRYLISPIIDSTTINAFIPKNMFDSVKGIVSSGYGGGIAF